MAATFNPYKVLAPEQTKALKAWLDKASGATRPFVNRLVAEFATGVDTGRAPAIAASFSAGSGAPAPIAGEITHGPSMVSQLAYADPPPPEGVTIRFEAVGQRRALTARFPVGYPFTLPYIDGRPWEGHWSVAIRVANYAGRILVADRGRPTAAGSGDAALSGAISSRRLARQTSEHYYEISTVSSSGTWGGPMDVSTFDADVFAPEFVGEHAGRFDMVCIPLATRFATDPPALISKLAGLRGLLAPGGEILVTCHPLADDYYMRRLADAARDEFSEVTMPLPCGDAGRRCALAVRIPS